MSVIQVHICRENQAEIFKNTSSTYVLVTLSRPLCVFWDTTLCLGRVVPDIKKNRNAFTCKGKGVLQRKDRITCPFARHEGTEEKCTYTGVLISP